LAFVENNENLITRTEREREREIRTRTKKYIRLNENLASCANHIRVELLMLQRNDKMEMTCLGDTSSKETATGINTVRIRK